MSAVPRTHSLILSDALHVLAVSDWRDGHGIEAEAMREAATRIRDLHLLVQQCAPLLMALDFELAPDGLPAGVRAKIETEISSNRIKGH